MARQLVLLLLFHLSAWPLAAQAPPAPDFDKLFVHALELQKAGDVFGAIQTYRAALTIDPTRVDALSNLGAAYVRLGQFDDAIAQYETALRVDPSNATVRMNLALAYYKSGRPTLAIQPLKMVLSAAPDTRNAYLILADCYLQTGQDREAVALLSPREAMFQDDLAFAYVLGSALVQTGDVQRGEVYIDRIFRAGESAEGHLLMGITHLNRFEYAAARTELERALALNPRLPTANSAYGRALLGLGDQSGAERAFRDELALNINDFEANLAIGSMRKNAHAFDDALLYLTRAVEIHPTELTARKLLAALRLQMGDVDEAVTLLEGVIKDAPEEVDAHVQLATAYNRLKRKDDVERERAIIDRLNREIQARQPAPGQAPGAAATPADAPSSAGPQ